MQTDHYQSGQMGPGTIQEKSFAIIDTAVDLSPFPAEERVVVRRCTHAAGDFAIAKHICFSPGAVKTGIGLARKRAPVFADVRMVEAGISKASLSRLSLSVHTYVDSVEAIELAGEKGWTRSEAAVWLYRGIIDGGIAVIGNAPTALWKILELAEKGIARPGLVIGMPVGFVGAADSKEALASSDLPFVTCIGTRGGSPLAAAAFNAVLGLAVSGR
ncbi:precorrin-8X methylmutase [Pelotomaculum propionicicum]|uniref:precorrin-8X methylmutase n=1 Tax=Pelotomaculum propionicicum TaxID=258475 RepID=UPI003B8070E6